MIKKIKRPLSILLVFLMVVSVFAIVPLTVSAAENDFYVVGTMTDPAWGINEAYKLTLNDGAEGTEYMITGLVFDKDTQIKVGQENSAGNVGAWYPDGTDNHFVIPEDGTYTVYFRPDGNVNWDSSGSHYFYLEKTGEYPYAAKIGDTPYKTFENAVAAISTVTEEYHSKSGRTINKYKANGTITLLANCEGNGIVIDSGSDLTIDFDGKTYDVTGELVGSNGTEYNGFQLLRDSNVTFENGTLTSATASFLVQNYSNLTLTNMTLDGSNLDGSGCYTLSNNNGNITIDGSTITAKAGAGNFAFDVCRYSSYPSVNVEVKGNSTINGNVEVSASKGQAKDGFSLTLTSGTLTGDVVIDNSAKSLIDNGGTVTKAAEFSQDAPADFKWVADGNNYKLVPCEYVAQIGDGTKFESLEDAIAAISTVTEEYHSKSGRTINKYKANGTITLLANCAGNGIVIDSGSDLTIDFDGRIYAVTGDLVGSNGTEYNGFQLLQNSDVTFKDGTITSAKASFLVQNYSNLTLTNMTLDGSNLVDGGCYTLSNNNGNITIDGSTITAKAGAGNFAFDVCRYASYPSVNVEVKGNSTINGNVEVSASKGDAKDGFSLTLTSGTMTGNIVVDPTAKGLIGEDNKVTKADTFEQAAPTGFKWVSNGDGTSYLAAKSLFADHKLDLRADIGLRFIIDPSAVGITNFNKAVAKFSFDNGHYTSEYQLVEAPTYGEGMYIAICNVPAAYMACPITAEVYFGDADEPAGIETISVQTVAENIIEKTDDAKLTTLINEMLNYGAKAQTVFQSQMRTTPALPDTHIKEAGYKMDTTVTADKIQTAINSNTANEGKAPLNQTVAAKFGAKAYTTSLIYLEQNTLRIYFTKKDDKFNPNDYDGNKGEYYYKDIKGIAPYCLDQYQTFRIGGVKFYYSAFDYAKAVVNSGMNDNQKNLAKSLYLFNQAAKAYFTT